MHLRIKMAILHTFHIYYNKNKDDKFNVKLLLSQNYLHYFASLLLNHIFSFTVCVPCIFPGPICTTYV